MFKVAIVGDDFQKTLFHTIYKVCATYGSVSCLNEKNADFCIESDAKFEHYDVMVLGENLDTDSTLPQADICILDSGNKQAVYLAHAYNLTVLTCSMSPYDTLTADAVADYENILISLRRDIVTTDGTVVEAQDFSLHLEQEMPLYPILAAYGVLLSCGIKIKNPAEYN
ncbi:MAG: hypothetical protein ACI4M3_01275 [Acutalibacteraceae bacterium]